MNEELETVNTELRVREDELSRLNNFVESILTSVTAGVVVIDRQFLVQVWNRGAADLWGLRAEEVKGASLFSLDIGLPVERLREPIAACLDGLDQRMTMLDAMNRRGRPLTCRVTCTRLPAATGEAEGVVLLMDAIPLEETLPEW
jgi:two-component system CheB/CheR fusion protein